MVYSEVSMIKEKCVSCLLLCCEPKQVAANNSAEFVAVAIQVAAPPMSFPLLVVWAHLHLYLIDVLNV
jgi:hypothetical protein